MSVEAFLAAKTRDHINATKLAEKEEGHERSIPYLVAVTFWRKGREGLLRITQRLNDSRIKIDPERSFFSQLPKDIADSARFNYEACIFGISLVALEDALIEKKVSKRRIVDFYNATFKNTFIPQWLYDGNDEEQLDDKNWRKLIGVADIKSSDSDRSLASFFEEDWHLVPKIIRTFLEEETKTLEPIRKKVIPPFRQLMVALIKEKMIARENDANR